MLATPLLSRVVPGPLNVNQLRQTRNESQNFPYNFFLCSFSFAKLLVNLAVLFTDKNQHPELRIWLIFLSVCDLISTTLLVVEIVHFFYMGLYTNEGRQDEESLATVEPNMSKLSDNKTFKIMIILNNCYYFILWGMGHYYYINVCTDCAQSLQVIASLTFFYLYCGYFFVGCSFLTAIINKDFLSFFSFFPSNILSNAKSSLAAIQKLPSKLYTSDMVGTTECQICLLNYIEGDKLSQLPCSSKHYFHEGCIMKWLKINNACPLCRKPIDKEGEAPTMNDIELPVIY